MSQAEFGVRLGDDAFAFLNREGVDGQAILLRDAESLQARAGVVFLRMISVPEVERAAHRADHVVVGLLGSRVACHDADQSRVPDFLECFRADLWPPYGIQDLPIAVECGKCHVIHGDAHLAVGQVGIEDLIAGQTRSLGVPRFRQSVPVPIVREVVLERENASIDPELDRFELYPGASQIGFRGSAPQCRAIAFAAVGEGEFDAILAFRANPAR